MYRKLVFVWSATVAWICSAFVHVVDSDVDGVQALLTPSALLSTTVIAALMLLPILVFWFAFRRGRWRGLFGVVFLIGIGSRMIVGIVSGGTGEALSENQQLVGLGTLYGLVLLITMIPAIWVEIRIKRQEEEPVTTPST